MSTTQKPRKRPNPGAAALERYNQQRAPAPGSTLWLGRAHIREDHLERWNALTPKDRGRIITAALEGRPAPAKGES